MKVLNKLSLGLVAVLLVMGITTIFVNKQTKTTVKAHNIGQTHLLGNYQIQIKLDPQKPKIGNNHLSLVIVDENDVPVSDIKIDMYAEMPAMGSMQAMREPISIEASGNGVYQGDYSLPMNGSWPISITLESKTQGKASALFDMNTSRQGVKLTQATASDLKQPVETMTEPEQIFAEFKVDGYRRQLIGVTTAEVIYQKVFKTIEANARVVYDQTTFTDIALQYDVWIGKLNADYVGKQIQQGETLFTVYSPELVSAQDEYLESLKPHHSFGMRKAAGKRLTRWGISSAQIKALQQRGRAIDYLPILSPVNGTVIAKNIVTGSAVKRGSSLLRLADLSTVWIEGEVYEADLPWLNVGMDAIVTLPELQEQFYTATVSYIDSVLNQKTHSIIVRVKVDNADRLLRPNMFANMRLQVGLGMRMIIPEQAVIHSGRQRIVFVDKGDGRFQPKKIKTGVRNKDVIEVLDGLDFGEMVVTSGNFLLAAESKLKSGLAQW